MEQVFFEDKVFEKIDFAITPFTRGEYEYCTFVNCDLSNLDLSESSFLECAFNRCNLSLAKLVNTTLRGIQFNDCKMLGLRFDDCNKFCLSFRCKECTLDHSSFYQLKLKKIHFAQCLLRETDFSECDLSEAIFAACDLTLAMFENTNLEKADLRTSINYTIDPTKNKIKKAKFALSQITGLLQQHDIVIDRNQ